MAQFEKETKINLIFLATKNGLWTQNFLTEGIKKADHYATYLLDIWRKLLFRPISGTGVELFTFRKMGVTIYHSATIKIYFGPS